MGYPASGPRPLYPALGPRPPKNFQPAQPPPTQSPVTPATCTCFKETALLFNVHLNCFVNFILCPTDKYMFKVNNKKIRLICWMCSKIKLNTTWHRSGVFIVVFDQSQYISIVFLLLTLNEYVSVGCERQVIMFWKQKKRHICFVIKVHSLYHSAIYIIAPNWNYEQMTILWTYCRVVGSFFMVMGGRLSKNVGHHDWPTTKNIKKKKHWLKRPIAVPKNEVWSKT